MSKPRRSRLARIKARARKTEESSAFLRRLTAVAMAVWGLLIVVLVAISWPIALVFAPIVLLLCWLVGVEIDDGFDDL